MIVEGLTLLGMIFGATIPVKKLTIGLISIKVFDLWLSEKELDAYKRADACGVSKADQDATGVAPSFIYVEIGKNDLPSQQEYAVGGYLVTDREFLQLLAGLQAEAIRGGYSPANRVLTEEIKAELSDVLTSPGVAARLKRLSKARVNDPDYRGSLTSEVINGVEGRK